MFFHFILDFAFLKTQNFSSLQDAAIDISQPIQIISTYKLYKDPAGCSGMPCPVLDQLGKKSTAIEVKQYSNNFGVNDVIE